MKRKKCLLYSCIVGLLLVCVLNFLLVPFLQSVFLFPLSRQGVEMQMQNHEIVSFAEEDGILVYLVQKQDRHVFYLFEPSVFLERYRNMWDAEEVTVEPFRFLTFGQRTVWRGYIAEDLQIEMDFYVSRCSNYFRTSWVHFISLVVIALTLTYYTFQMIGRKRKNTE